MATNVALLAEGVDRNNDELIDDKHHTRESPSSRRAWIEILTVRASSAVGFVALLAEGVDRNFSCRGITCLQMRRPPRGGRG